MIKNLRRIKRNVTKRVRKPELERFPKMPYPTVDLVYWRPRERVNFGDELGRTIVELMLARKGLTIFDETQGKRRLTTVGSILHFAETDTVVWGTGRNGAHPDRVHIFDRLDIRAVRGPRTREFLMSRGFDVPDVFGDPALLLPALTQDRFVTTREEDVVLMPNLNDYAAGFDFTGIGIPILHPLQSWNKAVSDILRYRLVLASSLHGLIIAEAFGIPARYVRFTEKEGLFKYHDYYEGTGRTMGSFARSVEEAIEMGGKEPPRFDAGSLMRAFPYDIWN